MEKKRQSPDNASGSNFSSPAELRKDIENRKQEVRKTDTLPEVKVGSPGTKPNIPGKIS